MEYLGWRPECTFHKLVRVMVQNDIQDILDLHNCKDVILKIVNNHNSDDDYPSLKGSSFDISARAV
jgi:hypothetical protein